MKCPYCDKEITDSPWDMSYDWDYPSDTHLAKEFDCTCPHCKKEFTWVQEYELVREFAR